MIEQVKENPCTHCRGWPTIQEAELHVKDACTCPVPCGAGGCPKASELARTCPRCNGKTGARCQCYFWCGKAVCANEPDTDEGDF